MGKKSKLGVVRPAAAAPPSDGLPELNDDDDAPHCGETEVLSSHGVFAAKNMLSAAECARLVDWAEAAGLEETSHPSSREMAFARTALRKKMRLNE